MTHPVIECLIIHFIDRQSNLGDHETGYLMDVFGPLDGVIAKTGNIQRFFKLILKKLNQFFGIC